MALAHPDKQSKTPDPKKICNNGTLPRNYFNQELQKPLEDMETEAEDPVQDNIKMASTNLCRRKKNLWSKARQHRPMMTVTT